MRYNDYDYRLIPGGAEITGYVGSAGDVVFPDEIEGQPVISLGRCAFVANLTMVNVTVPATVTEIGFGAFEGCLNLRSINLPSGLTRIGFRAFARCEQLEEAILPDSVTVLEEGVYNGCSVLRTLRLSAGLKVISRNAFLGCNALTEVLIPEGVERIEAQAFSGCGNIVTLTIPSTVTEIGSDAIQGCGRLVTFNVPDCYRSHIRDLRVGYGLMVQDGLTIVGSFTYMMLRGVAILEDYEGPSVELAIPNTIEGHPVGGINHVLFLNLADLKTVSLPRRLASVSDIIPEGVTITYRD